VLHKSMRSSPARPLTSPPTPPAAADPTKRGVPTPRGQLTRERMARFRRAKGEQ
jgi:hypothetical protein